MLKPNNQFNIEPANRLKSVSEYYFSSKLKEIAQMNAEGKQVINLGIGSPDLPPSESTIMTICDESKKSNTHGYQPYNGIPELRTAFAKWYKKWYNVDIEPTTEVLPLMGSKEGILHISLAFLNPGDSVLVPNPGYPTYTSVSILAEANIFPYNLKAENDWYPDFEEIEKQDLSKVKLMWVNYPNMPTGKQASIELFEKLVAFGKKHSIVIVNDNPYSFILNDNPLSILNIEGAKDICIEMNSMSKSHNMPGWRIGICASNPQFINWIINVKSNIDSGMFKPLQLAAVEALSNSSEWHANMNDIYKERRVSAMKILKLLDCEYDEKQVGMFLWAKVPEKYKNGAELADSILYNANVFITPGFIFGDQGDQYIRISLCSDVKHLNEAHIRINEKHCKN